MKNRLKIKKGTVDRERSQRTYRSILRKVFCSFLYRFQLYCMFQVLRLFFFMKVTDHCDTKIFYWKLWDVIITKNFLSSVTERHFLKILWPPYKVVSYITLVTQSEFGVKLYNTRDHLSSVDVNLTMEREVPVWTLRFRDHFVYSIRYRSVNWGRNLV